MTTKLYYEDVYLSRFEAAVVEAAEKEGSCHAALDRTAFYPEGGGQPSDLGTLNGIPVTHVYDVAGIVWHVLDAPVKAGDSVEGQVDWVRRHHYMQQHLGQHILSAVLVKHLDTQTASVHFGESLSTLDTDKPLAPEDLDRVEQLCGQVVYGNIPVETLFPSREEIRRAARRKIPETGEPIRIVKIGDLDYTPCCGTHCGRTGEAGPVKLWKLESYKGGSRLSFSCGEAAMERTRSLWSELSAAARLLSAGELEVAERVAKLTEELQALRKQNRRLLEDKANAEAGQLLADARVCGELKVVSHVLEEASQEDLKRLHARLTGQENVVALLGGANGAEAALVYGCSKGLKGVDVRPLLRDSLIFIDGKGGGGPTFAQGKGKVPEQLKAAVDIATAAVIAQIEQA